MAHAALEAWLRLVFFSALSRRQCRLLLTEIGLPEVIFGAATTQLIPYLEPAAIARLRNPPTPAQQAQINAALAWQQHDPSHHAIVPLDDARYPTTLLELADPPLLLFAQGQFDLWHTPAIAIVGSRQASAQGVRDAENFAFHLAQAGYTIISGLAQGIDAAAHQGALKHNQPKTIALIGTGINLVYPAANKALAHAISARGLIVSEFMWDAPAAAFHFPQRNRLIAGLAQGVLVMEAALQSGSLITARLAAEQGREVFAVPGSIHSPLSRGAHALIRQGAKLVEQAQDILEELRPSAAASPQAAPIATTRPQAPATKHRPMTQASGTADLVPNTDHKPAAVQSTPQTDATPDAIQRAQLAQLGVLPLTIDQIAQQLNCPIELANQLLLEWELAGLVAREAGGRYQRLFDAPP